MLRRRHSAGFRLALAYAALFGLSTLVLVGFLWWDTTAVLNRRVDAAILADGHILVEVFDEGGLPALIDTIGTRVAGNVDSDAVYMLGDAEGRWVAGNLLRWPDGVARAGPVYEVGVERRGALLARLHRFTLADGHALLVGRDVQARVAIHTLMAETLLSALAVVVILGAAGALFIHNMFRRMLAQVADTAAAVSAGDLTTRVQLSGRGDEFDRLAATINAMLDRIQRLMDGVRQVSNNIAHDLRTPITRARARLEDAAAHATTDTELRTAVDRAVSELDDITGVFQALLRIAEIEAGARRSAFTRLDVAPLLVDLAELYGVAAEERGLQLVLEVERPLPLHGDRMLIQQAVANLLDNALKFSPAGSVVHLRAARTPNGVRIGVRDLGPGIPPADRARATERFFRGEAARHTAGFGLGLTLVRAVAGLHGGTLALQDAQPGMYAVLTLSASAPSDNGVAPERHNEDIAMRRLAAD